MLEYALATQVCGDTLNTCLLRGGKHEDEDGNPLVAWCAPDVRASDRKLGARWTHPLLVFFLLLAGWNVTDIKQREATEDLQ